MTLIQAIPVLMALAVAFPFLTSLTVFTVGRKLGDNGRDAISVIGAILTFCLVFSILYLALWTEEGRAIWENQVPFFKTKQEEAVTAFVTHLDSPYKGMMNYGTLVLSHLTDTLSLKLIADPAALIFAGVSSSLWVIAAFYSIGYMRGHNEKNLVGFFSSFAVCIGAALGIAFSGNLLTFFIFFEVLTIATYPLVVHHRDRAAIKAGRKYLIYTLVSGQILFAAIVYIYYVTGTLDFSVGGIIGNKLPDGQVILLFAMMALAGAVKAGLMPFHSWLPSAMVAPTPVSALLHAVAVVKAGVFALVRIVFYIFGQDLIRATGISNVMLFMAGFTILVSSLIALTKTNLKARLAYSTVGQLSYMIAGIFMVTEEAVVGGMYHIVAHAYLKITLFMCAGAIYVNAHKSDIRDMAGLGKSMPKTFSAFIVASLGIAGMPLLPGFYSKLNLVEGAFEGHYMFVFIFIASALLSLTYLMPVGYLAFAPHFSMKGNGTEEKLQWSRSDKSSDNVSDKDEVAKESGHDHGQQVGEASKLMVVPIWVTVILALWLGLSGDGLIGAKTLAKQVGALLFGQM